MTALPKMGRLMQNRSCIGRFLSFLQEIHLFAHCRFSCREIEHWNLCYFSFQLPVKTFFVYMHNKSSSAKDDCFVIKDNLFFRKLNRLDLQKRSVV